MYVYIIIVQERKQRFIAIKDGMKVSELANQLHQRSGTCMNIFTVKREINSFSFLACSCHTVKTGETWSQDSKIRR